MAVGRRSLRRIGRRTPRYGRPPLHGATRPFPRGVGGGMDEGGAPSATPGGSGIPAARPHLHGHARASDHRTACAVCLQEMMAEEKAVRLPCDHMFNEECVRQWSGGSDFVMGPAPPGGVQGAGFDVQRPLSVAWLNACEFLLLVIAYNFGLVLSFEQKRHCVLCVALLGSQSSLFEPQDPIKSFQNFPGPLPAT